MNNFGGLELKRVGLTSLITSAPRTMANPHNIQLRNDIQAINEFLLKGLAPKDAQLQLTGRIGRHTRTT
ncbi:hypothetical protein Q4Q57_15410 [Shewanella sp. SP2S2-6]|uniref:hypothetical protein n=1 Tax=Shewanella sp. SP2S2-6 TaxID=3063540 RepID=UPI00288D8C93|nr:hypothetical protein [Shewanella sp. SP2S2-6]MDT3296531.1 hypothetical protein [Shewanella sp. SP2S2-6]